MQETPPLSGQSLANPAAEDSGRYIYIAGPWGPVGGGMFKVADYLIQSQARRTPEHAARLRALDTRGGGSAVSSVWVLGKALGMVVRGRISGRLAGVHVNMAERLSVWRKGVLIVACRALSVPVVLHLHAAQLQQFYRTLPGPLQRLTRWVFALPASVVVLGGGARRFVVEELGVPVERVEIVINGVPEPALAPVAAAGGVRRVLFLGNLSERKGVTDLLEALARPGPDRSRMEVVLAGGGDVAGYAARASRLGLDGLVRFAGWCDQRQVAELMARTDVLVLPSYDEGLPLAILEALAHGVAVICSPVGEIPQVLTDGVDACFVKPGDVEGIAAALQKVLAQPELLESLGRNGRALYQRQFSVSRFFACIARIHARHFGVAGQLEATAP